MSLPKTTRFGVDPLLAEELANKRYVDAQTGAGIDLTTKGDIHGFSSVDERIPVGATNGDVLTVDSAEALGVKYATPAGGGGLIFAKVIKTVDETVNNSSTLQDDDVLLFTPNINKVYFGTIFTVFISGSTPDIKSAFTLPSGATGQWMASNALWRMGAQTWSTITTAISQVAGGSDQTFANYFRIQMGATAGDINYVWAQATANASDTKVLIGSALIVYEE